MRKFLIMTLFAGLAVNAFSDTMCAKGQVITTGITADGTWWASVDKNVVRADKSFTANYPAGLAAYNNVENLASASWNRFYTPVEFISTKNSCSTGFDAIIIHSEEVPSPTSK